MLIHPIFFFIYTYFFQTPKLFMRLAVSDLEVKPDILLNDAVTIPEAGMKQVPIIKGDAKSISIAAASIIAKVTRDGLVTAVAEGVANVRVTLEGTELSADLRNARRPVFLCLPRLPEPSRL